MISQSSNITKNNSAQTYAELLDVLRRLWESSTVCWEQVFLLASSIPCPENRIPAKQTLSSSSPMTDHLLPSISISLRQHPSLPKLTLPVMHAQALLSAVHRVTATTPRHCSTTRTCPSSKAHPENDPGLSTSSPFVVISTKNIWMQAKTYSVWQTLPKCMNFTLNTFAFSAISDGNTTVLQINVS